MAAICLRYTLGGVDYSLTPTELTFPTDSEQGDIQCVEVEIFDDEAVENSEAFYVELSTDNSDVQLLDYYKRRGFYIDDNDGKI